MFGRGRQPIFRRAAPPIFNGDDWGPSPGVPSCERNVWSVPPVDVDMTSRPWETPERWDDAPNPGFDGHRRWNRSPEPKLNMQRRRRSLLDPDSESPPRRSNMLPEPEFEHPPWRRGPQFEGPARTWNRSPSPPFGRPPLKRPHLSRPSFDEFRRPHSPQYGRPPSPIYDRTFQRRPLFADPPMSVTQEDLGKGPIDNDRERFKENGDFWERLGKGHMDSAFSKERSMEEVEKCRTYLLNAPPMQSNFSRHLIETMIEFERSKEEEERRLADIQIALVNESHPAYNKSDIIPAPEDRNIRNILYDFDGPAKFPPCFDTHYTLKTFDLAYEQSIWDYDPKFSWDYLPNTKRGTKKLPDKEFVVNQDYIREEHKWKKWSRVLDNFWSKEFVPKVIARQKLIEAGITPPDDSKKRMEKPQSDTLIEYLTENVKFSEDMCTPEYCGLCDRAFKSVLPSIEHYEDKKHEKAVSGYFFNILYDREMVKDEDLDKKWFTDLERRILKIYKWKPEIHECEVCDVILSSISMAKTHFAGSSHSRRLKGLPPVQKVAPHKLEALNHQCVACEVFLETQEEIDVHIESVAHATNVRACGAANIKLPPGPSSRMPFIKKTWGNNKRMNERMQKGEFASVPPVNRGKVSMDKGRGISVRGWGKQSLNNRGRGSINRRPGFGTDITVSLGTQIGYSTYSVKEKITQFAQNNANDDGGGSGGNTEPMGKRRSFGKQLDCVLCKICNKVLPSQQTYNVHIESQAHIQRETKAAKQAIKAGRNMRNSGQMLAKGVTVDSLGVIPGGPSKVMPSLQAALAKAKSIPCRKPPPIASKEFEQWGNAGGGLGEQIWGELSQLGESLNNIYE